MKRFRTLRYHLLLFLFGIVSALPLLFKPLAFFCFVFLIPFYLCLRLSLKSGAYKRVYLKGLCYFQGYFMTAFSFFYSMYPLEFVGLDRLASLAVLFAAMVLLPLLQASVFALSAWLLSLLHRFGFLQKPIAFSFAFAALWTVFSYLQNFTWLGVPWAPVSLALTAFPVLIGSASFFGSCFLIFLIVFINALLGEGILFFRSERKRHAALYAGLALVVFLGNLGLGALSRALPKATGEPLRIALIQGDTSSVDDYRLTPDEILSAARKMAYRAAEQKPDIMLWAEAVSLSAMETDSSAKAYFSAIAEETGSIQVIGSYSVRDDCLYNSLFVFYPDGSMSKDVYDKRRPVPFGEFLPWAPFFRALIPPLANMSMLSRDMTPGKGPNLLHLPSCTVGGLVCFDSIYPALSRASARAGADILFLSTNDSWFDGSFAKDIHFSHAILRAVETGKCVARTGNTGISGFILPDGSVKSTAQRDTRTFLVDTVNPIEGRTLYTVIGDIFVYLLLAALAAPPLIRLIRAFCCKIKKERIETHGNHTDSAV